MRKKRMGKWKEVLQSHISNNRKEYIIVTLFFIIGVFLGVLFINYTGESQHTEISTYLNQFLTKVSEKQDIDQMAMFQVSLWENIVLVITIWFFGTTLIGLPVVFGIVAYRGFCLGYTISACIQVLGFSKGLVFVLSTLVVQNLIFIPVLLALAVSGFKLYQSIVKDKRKENIKFEMVRHTLFSLMMMAFLCVASVLEVFISANVLRWIVPYWNQAG